MTRPNWVESRKWLREKNTGWFSRLAILTPSSNECGSRKRIVLSTAKSSPKADGELKSLRCNTPNSPAPGWANTCPGKGASPSPATPLLSRGLMAPSAIKNGPSPVMRNRTMSSSWPLFKAVTAVFSIERIRRFNVPRPERIDSGAPDCHETIEEIVHPSITRLSGA